MTAKRGPIALTAAAAAGFLGALGFHVSGSTAPVAAAASAPTGGQNASATTSPPTGDITSTSAAANPSTAATGPSGPVTKTGSGPTVLRSATGPVEQYGYGQLAVRVTVNGTKITSLSVVGLQTAESYSQQIADQVIPMLHNEVLAAQNAQVNGISGASYTTQAYLSSIQSALDTLHIK